MSTKSITRVEELTLELIRPISQENMRSKFLELIKKVISDDTSNLKDAQIEWMKLKIPEEMIGEEKIGLTLDGLKNFPVNDLLKTGVSLESARRITSACFLVTAYGSRSAAVKSILDMMVLKKNTFKAISDDKTINKTFKDVNCDTTGSGYKKLSNRTDEVDISEFF
jgi:hypothetical protein